MKEDFLEIEHGTDRVEVVEVLGLESFVDKLLEEVVGGNPPGDGGPT